MSFEKLNITPMRDGQISAEVILHTGCGSAAFRAIGTSNNRCRINCALLKGAPIMLYRVFRDGDDDGVAR